MEELDPFFEYYQRELDYLRNSGAHFARQFPKIAKRLDIGGLESADPHIERLIESFAYLTARLQRTIDDDFPQITSALLGVLYPQFIDPIPSMAIAQFKTAPDVGKLTTGYKINRNTTLYTYGTNEDICYFKTCYPIELFPIEITDVAIVAASQIDRGELLESARALKISLRSYAGSFSSMDLQKLRFYIAGSTIFQAQLHEALFAQDPVRIIATNGTTTQIFPLDSLGEVGYEEDEILIPYKGPPHHLGHRLMSEYFHFPDKFLFFDLLNLDLIGNESQIDLYISLFTNTPLKMGDVTIKNLTLNCVPIINLFSKISEPIRIDQRTTEYRLIPDQRREKTTEIHSILKVSAAVEDVEAPKVFSPYFGFNHTSPDLEEKSFWHARRVPVLNPDLSGTDILISFVDFDFNPELPPSDVVYAHTLCTNRSLAHQISAKSVLQSETSLPVTGIYCLERPTPQFYPPQEGKTQWQLISNLCLNHLSLSQNRESLEALKEIVRLYANMIMIEDRPEIEALNNLQTETITRRFNIDTWRGFLQGTKVMLTFEQIGNRETHAFLFASVLNRFFSLYASINSFTQLEIINNKRQGIWKQWPALSGNKKLL